MKCIIPVLLSLLFTSSLLAQQDIDNSILTDFTRDTVLAPDYFTLKVTVAEYFLYEKKGRKTKSSLVPMDTVIIHLRDKLNQLGFRQAINKVRISEFVNSYYGRTEYWDGKPLVQTTFELTSFSKDSIQMLFRGLSDKMLVGITATPGFNEITLLQVKEKMLQAGLDTLRAFTQRLAERNGQRVIKQPVTSVSFYKTYKDTFADRDTYGQPKKYFLDMEDVKYTFTLHYSCQVADK